MNGSKSQSLLGHLRDQALWKDNIEINFVASTIEAAKHNMGLLENLCHDEIEKINQVQHYIIFKNGSRVSFLSAEQPQNLRGKQSHHTFFLTYGIHGKKFEEIDREIKMQTRLGHDPGIFYYD